MTWHTAIATLEGRSCKVALQAPSQTFVWFCRFRPICCLKIRSTGGKVVCAWPSLSDPVVCRAGDSHDCCDEEAESFVSKTGQQLLVLFAMNATKTMPPRVQCLASVTLPLVFWFSFVLDIKVVFPLPFLHICFSALPPLKRSLILSYIRENVALWEISI